MGEKGRARVGRGREKRIGEESVVESKKILKIDPEQSSQHCRLNALVCGR